MTQRPLHELDPYELRIVGSLMEKELATPEYYPLTLKGLVAACNQKSNRNPVMSIAEIDVLNILRVLLQDELVERVTGARVDRWSHRLDHLFRFDSKQKALVTLFALRGPQTPGQLRSRAERLHSFTALEEVETTLQEMLQGDPPLVIRLERQPGQKETRWGLYGQGEAASAAGVAQEQARRGMVDGGESWTVRISRLEEACRQLSDRVESLEEQLAGLSGD